jgi:hypothetical protein
VLKESVDGEDVGSPSAFGLGKKWNGKKEQRVQRGKDHNEAAIRGEED